MIKRLTDIMATLRSPKGCQWDRAQGFASIAPYTIEEAYEVAEAIENNDMDSLKDELGDLLFQVVFHARMAEEKELFDFSDVVEAICAKMIRRHPHVFGEEKFRSAEEQTAAWETQKADERRDAGKTSILDGVTVGLPAFTRAVKLQKRAARVGFDWPETKQVLDKLNEEMEELSAELVQEDNQERIEEEFGDMMFVYANLARHLKIDPETALRKANIKFERRFKKIEQYVEKEEKTVSDCTLEKLEEYWQKAKQEEHHS